MKLERAMRRVRVLRRGMVALTAIYKRDRSLRGTAAQTWFVATRQGLVGLHDWLVTNLPQNDPVTGSAETEEAPTGELAEPAPGPGHRELYAEWLRRFDPLNGDALLAARRHLATLDLPPFLILSVVTPATLPWVARMMASWRESIHPGWQGALLASPALSGADKAQLDGLATDPRVLVVSTADELQALRARFSHALVCVGGVLLNSLSAYMFLEAAIRTGADIVYADHDRIDEDGTRSEPAFKPQFSPEYLAGFNYIGDCLLLSRAVPLSRADVLSLLRSDVAEYDRLVERLTRGRTVEHVPFSLSHVVEELPHAPHDPPAIPDTGPSAAVIIPTRDGLDYLRACIDSITERTTYDLGRVEIVVVDNNSADDETLRYLQELSARPNVTVVRFPGAFNFAEINNAGARATTRDILVFLNNDTTVHDPTWLSKLVWHARQPGVGMVGGRLLFPDGTVQHGGCAAGLGRGTVQHLLYYAREDEVAATDHTREMTTMTGACIAVRRDVFERIGGFDPILRITWNDVKACLECLALGLRNIYVADSLMVHHESKTRGPDHTREHYLRYFSEADYTRRNFRDYFYDDPSYSPNLSADIVGELAEPPRVRRPWFRTPGRPARILLLSAQYRVGFGVPLVIRQHALKLRELGYDVVIGGPAADNEFDFPGCERVVLGSIKEAAEYAFTQGVALVVSHTPPFFSLPILIGGHIPVLAYDYGEPGAEFFDEPVRSYLLDVGYGKREAAALTTTIATISQAVKDETLNRDALVLGLANSHLPAWSEAFRPDRDRFRRDQGWEDAFVVLTVCRFHANERVYKGLDKIGQILREMPYLYPEASRRLVWVLAGAGSPEDVEQAEAFGFTVFPNVSDAMLADLYRSADAYMGMSLWEGYNLGISQALAMGLPTLGSDIPAHREFPITTTNSVLAACAWLAGEVGRRTAATPARQATVYEWDRSTAAFAKVVEDMLRNSAAPKPRRGASGCARDEVAACRA